MFLVENGQTWMEGGGGGGGDEAHSLGAVLHPIIRANIIWSMGLPEILCRRECHRYAIIG